MEHVTEQPRDADLAGAAAAGDEIAFAALVTQHAARLHEFLRTVTGSRADLDDLTQTVWIQVYRQLHRYDPARPFRPWLFTMARRAAIDAWRRRPPPAEPLLETDWTETRHPASEFLRAGEAAGIWRWVEAHVGPEARQALWLMYREELSVREIASVLRCSVVRVKVMLHRARKRLAAAHAAGARPDSVPLAMMEGTLP